MAELFLILLLTYLTIGALFAVLFLGFGIERLDAAARRAPWSFRFLIFPGVAALWPLLALRWRQALRTKAAS